ncbi:unnamed protein product [Microthlaspi erraticum]|uniref:Uncharacterized protein n=1 Tax=Microthlaspi erraticum TaxID=1685480 RepID=A0A6D2IY46_9BRAS|nr:unnamed protein product [Microthlaspi erraticum]
MIFLASLTGAGFRKDEWLTRGQLDRVKSKLDRVSRTQSSGVLLMAVYPSPDHDLVLPVLWGALRSFGAFWSIWDKEHGGTWHMEAAQLDTQRKKGEAILKTSSTVHSTNRSSSSTRPAKLQLDRAEKSKSNPKNAAWAVKELNFNLKTAAERRLIQLNELEEIRHLAYENSQIYKEKTKALHDRNIVPKSFAANDQIKEVKPYGAVVLWDPSGGDFTVYGQRLKPYLANSEKGVEEIIPLADAPQE